MKKISFSGFGKKLAALILALALVTGALPGTPFAPQTAKAATTLSVGDCVYFGKYYATQPILWRVTEVNGNQATLLSEYVLFNAQYHDSNSYSGNPTLKFEDTYIYTYWLCSDFKNGSFTPGPGGEAEAITNITLPVTTMSLGAATDRYGDQEDYWLANSHHRISFADAWYAYYIGWGGLMSSYSVTEYKGVRPVITIDLNADIFNSKDFVVPKITAVTNTDTVGHRAGEDLTRTLDIDVSGEYAKEGDIVRVTLTSGANTTSAEFILHASDLANGVFTHGVYFPSLAGMPAGTYTVSAALIAKAGDAEIILSTVNAANAYPIIAAEIISVSSADTSHTVGQAPAGGLDITVRAPHTRIQDTLLVEMLDSGGTAKASGTFSIGWNGNSTPAPFTVNIPQAALNALPAGTYTYRATLTNVSSVQLNQKTNVSADYAVNAVAAPAITSANSATFTVGTAGSFSVTATNTPASFACTGTLPAGVSFHTATGILSGTPAAGTAGNYSLSFTATNSKGTSAAQNFTLTVGAVQPPPSGGGSGATFNPNILFVNATPIAGGTLLSISAMSGNYSQTYQWQVKQPNGAWANIPGATSSTFNYTGLTSGQGYTIRCIVRNSAGGQTISQERMFTTGAANTFSVKGFVTGKNINVHANPSKKGKALSKMQKGDEIVILGYENGFFIIAWGNAQGFAYISANYVRAMFGML